MTTWNWKKMAKKPERKKNHHFLNKLEKMFWFSYKLTVNVNAWFPPSTILRFSQQSIFGGRFTRIWWSAGDLRLAAPCGAPLTRPARCDGEVWSCSRAAPWQSPKPVLCLRGEPFARVTTPLSPDLFVKRLADAEGEGRVFKARSAHNWSQISGGALLPFKHLKRVTGLSRPAVPAAGNESRYGLTPAPDK